MSEPQNTKAPVKSARRRAREFAVQALYQWQLTQDSVGNIERFLKDSTTSFVRADEELFRMVFFGSVKEVEGLTVALAPHIDRPFVEISPVEKAILYAGAYEIIHMPQTPYPVIVNEAIELAKTFGGTDGHKFVNGVLDKLAAVARPDEIASVRAKRQGA
ncbi:MAG: transcription antitermination factor NusB [Formivibrio sp.]|nr:transcription antitermination factor NusB [Formivibrio sp.]